MARCMLSACSDVKLLMSAFAVDKPEELQALNLEGHS